MLQEKANNLSKKMATANKSIAASGAWYWSNRLFVRYAAAVIGSTNKAKQKFLTSATKQSQAAVIGRRISNTQTAASPVRCVQYQLHNV
jgi:hypothetical protein